MNLFTFSPALTLLLLNCNGNSSEKSNNDTTGIKTEISSIKPIKGLEIMVLL